MSIPTTPMTIRCTKCGEHFWDAHVCAQDIKPVSKALEIATELEKTFPRRDTVRQEAAAELRRLESEYNAALANWQHMQEAYQAERAKSLELLEALKLIECSSASKYETYSDAFEQQQNIARAAIQKHGGGA